MPRANLDGQGRHGVGLEKDRGPALFLLPSQRAGHTEPHQSVAHPATGKWGPRPGQGTELKGVVWCIWAGVRVGQTAKDR